jgi:hypothetical protein
MNRTTGGINQPLPCAPAARSWHVGGAAKEERSGVEVRTIERHPAGQELPSAASQRAALRTFSGNQNGKLALILRTRSAQIGVQPAIIDGQLDGQIGS